MSADSTPTAMQIKPDEQSAIAEFDPITAEVIRSSFDNITKEMSLVLLRTSGSPVLTESKDFSTVLFDRDLNQIGSSGYVLIHMSSSRLGVKAVVEQRVPHDINPGDAFLCNDPHTSGACHQGDVGVVMPIFYDDEIVGWTFSNAHLMDIGGAAISGFAPEARDCYSEALRFPGTRVARQAVLDQEWIKFIGNNVRVPGSFISDLRSLVAACNQGGARVCNLIDEYGLDVLESYSKYNIDLTEQALGDRIAQLPEGTIQTYDWVEYDGTGVAELYPVYCDMTVADRKLSFKFSGSPQVSAFINAGQSALEGNLIGPIMCQLAPDIPFNEGFWRCLEIDRGEPGTILHPVVPAPVTSGHANAGVRAARMVQEAISTACSLSDSEELRSRTSAIASGGITLCFWFGQDVHGSPTMFAPFGMAVGVGGSGQTIGDGQDNYCMPASLSITWADVEVEEMDSPVLMLWRRLHKNVSGAGRYRGGGSIDEAFLLHGVDNFIGNTSMPGTEVPAGGFSGGLPGGSGAAQILRDTNVDQIFASGKLPSSPELVGGTDPGNRSANATHLSLHKGDVFRGLASCGGGLGDPFLRPPEEVQMDIDDGVYGANAAESLYGAVLVDGNKVDVDATWQNRDEIRADLVSTKSVSLRDVPSESGALGILRNGDQWACSHCQASLGSIANNWKNTVEPRTRDLADLFDAAQTQIRRRENGAVTVAERYCPSCGSCLSVDVGVEGQSRPHPVFRVS
jgi:N-methylhydantoinase B